MTYNGWTNYETWNVNLWIDNEEPIYREKMRLIRRACSPITGNTVRRFFADNMNGTTPDLDSLRERGETIDPIDFDEIAEHWDEERKEYDAELEDSDNE